MDYPVGGNYWSDHLYPDHFNDTARPQTTGHPDWFNDMNYDIGGGLSQDEWPYTFPSNWLLTKPVHNLDSGIDYASIGEAIQMASSNPAKLMNLKDIGEIRPGNRADLILFTLEDGEIHIQKTIIEGKVVYE